MALGRTFATGVLAVCTLGCADAHGTSDTTLALDAALVDAAASDTLLDAGPSPDVGARDVIALDDFCTRLVASVCSLDRACACDTFGQTLDQCESDGRVTCEQTFRPPPIAADLAGGVITYDGTAAAALIGRLDARPPDCRELYDVMGLDRQNVTTLAEVFIGTRAIGAACSSVETPLGPPSECAPPGRCAMGTCVAPILFGDPCDASGSCFDPAASVAGTGTPAGRGRCVADASGALVCGPLGAAGETCGADSECATARCATGACAAPLTDGAVCTQDVECASGWCHAGATASDPHTCGSAGTGVVGAACRQDEDCALDLCYAAMGCGAPVCNTTF